MIFKLRNKEGKLSLPLAIAVGFSISFLVCIGLVISTPLAGRLIEGGVDAEKINQMARLSAALTSFWWWMMVSIIGLAIATCMFRSVFSE
ncbi:hypothetical protein HOF56_04990 [Candidatus Peribacteria bacterium]|jgi:hypothetical protein|nr:hypothetical protein [Candidatus Peribacteria bacterium]MBT4021606.1 hypothetical protein [Candidatus Peribacteria bacterium]MBT4240499.1 hypothetical protein [Candidatus Peribacteria bacterium]MBT4474320.1 hypothetical protein [Candidatus Peribacteria bacterium]